MSDPDDDDDDCPACDGTGEGMHEGESCIQCGGRSWLKPQRTREEPDDDYHF